VHYCSVNEEAARVKIWLREEEDGTLQMQRGQNWCRCYFDVDGTASVKFRSWWPTVLQWWLVKHGISGCSPSCFLVDCVAFSVVPLFRWCCCEHVTALKLQVCSGESGNCRG